MKTRFFYGYVIAASGFTVWVVAWGMSQTFGIFYKPLLTEFGWSRAEGVLAYSMVSIIQAFLGIVMGGLTDRLGPRIVITVFGAFLGIAYLLLSQMNALWQFQLFYALAAIGLSTATIPVMATIARWWIKKRGLVTGIVQAGAGIGGFVFSPLTGWLILEHGWRSAYVVLGIIALASTIMAGLAIRRDPGEKGQLADGAKEQVKSPGKRPAQALQNSGFSLKDAIRRKHFWVLAGLFFSFGFGRSTFLPHIAAHVQDLGFSLADGATVVAVLTVSSIGGRLWMGWMSNRLVYIVSFALTTVALIWALMTKDLWGLYLFSVIFGFAWGAQAVLRFTVVAEEFGLAFLGLIMGVLGFAEAGASAFGSYYAGYMFDITGSYQAVFITGIGVSLLGVALSYFLKTPSSHAD